MIEYIDDVPIVANKDVAWAYLKEHPEYHGPVIYDGEPSGFLGSSQPVSVDSDGMGFVSVVPMQEEGEMIMRILAKRNGKEESTR